MIEVRTGTNAFPNCHPENSVGIRPREEMYWPLWAFAFMLVVLRNSNMVCIRKFGEKVERSPWLSGSCSQWAPGLED